MIPTGKMYFVNWGGLAGRTFPFVEGGNFARRWSCVKAHLKCHSGSENGEDEVERKWGYNEAGKMHGAAALNNIQVDLSSGS